MSFLGSLAPANSVSIPDPYQLGHTAGADRGAYGGIQSLDQYNLGGKNLDLYNQLTMGGVFNPYASQFQQGAGVAGQMGEAAGAGAYGAGGNLMQGAQSLLPDVQSLISLGFDPQNALYARTQQQVADQNAARSAASGVGGTPYGQGVANQSNSNFNIDWQNQQLSRAAMGAGAAGNLLGSIGQGTQMGAGLQNAGINEYLAGAAQPWQTANQIQDKRLGYLQGAEQYGNAAAQIPQQQIQDYLAYLSQANQNQQTGISAQQLNLQKQKEAFNEMQTMGSDIGSALGGMGGMGGGFGGMGGMGGYGGGAGFGGFGNFFSGLGGGGGGGFAAFNPYPGGPPNPTFY